MDTALHAVDTAIDRIKREVEIQKQKSDNMCKFKTAHNWQVIWELVIVFTQSLFFDKVDF